MRASVFAGKNYRVHIGSSLVPNCANGPLLASSGLTGFLAARPNSGLPAAPGCTHGYSRAVEGGAASRLNPWP